MNQSINEPTKEREWLAVSKTQQKGERTKGILRVHWTIRSPPELQQTIINQPINPRKRTHTHHVQMGMANPNCKKNPCVTHVPVVPMG
jgi:hypothetical protein